jgi:hypothetical protein
MWENFGSMSIDWNNKQQQQQPQQQHDAAAAATAAANAAAAAAADASADAHKHSESSSSTKNGNNDAAACIAMCDGVCAAVATFRVHNAHGVPVLQTTKSSCTRWDSDFCYLSLYTSIIINSGITCILSTLTQRKATVCTVVCERCTICLW